MHLLIFVLFIAGVDTGLVKVRRPESASLVSKMKSYVSPYAQPGRVEVWHACYHMLCCSSQFSFVVRRKSPMGQRKSTSTPSASISKAKQQRGIYMTCITQYGSTVYIGIAMGCPAL